MGSFEKFFPMRRATVLPAIIIFISASGPMRAACGYRHGCASAYPDEMTIVLQHQFWDLNVTDQAFEVGLSFKNIPEMLLIPFDAITRFSDPSAEFDLKFTLADELVETGANDKGFPHPQSASPFVFETSPPEQAPPLLPPLGQENDAALSAELEEAGDGAETAAQGEAKVVSIEAFRKKS